MIQKCTALVLAALLLFGCGLSLAEGAEKEFVMANPTRSSGLFFTDLWGNNTTDIDIRFLLHGQGNVAYFQGGVQAVNAEVIQAFDRSVDESGQVTYTFKLREDLRFSDGSPLTAQDFAGSVLLQAGADLSNLSGAASPNFTGIVGQKAYFGGETDRLSGLRVLNNHAFSLTISKEALPSPFELNLVSVIPYPLHNLLPGAQVVNSDQGAGFAEPVNQEALRTVLLSEEGYLNHPKVTAGPYTLASYAAQTGEVVLARNSFYTGAAWPERIRVIKAQDNALESLKNGDIQLLTKIALDKVAKDAQSFRGIQTAAYGRSGLAYLTFEGQQGKTASLSFRKALASLINREEIVKNASVFIGAPVYGLYGTGHKEVKGREAELKQLLHLYPFNLQTADLLLEADGWTLNDQGEAWSTPEGLRYRKNGDSLEALRVTLAITKGSQVGLAVANQLEEQLALVGGQLIIKELSADALFDAASKDGRGEMDLVFMGSNFAPVYDPIPRLAAVSGVADPALVKAADTLGHLSSGEDYQAAWLAFQQRLVEVLPIIPLYSNAYLDAFSPDLNGYQPGNHVSPALALLAAEWKPE